MQSVTEPVFIQFTKFCTKLCQPPGNYDITSTIHSFVNGLILDRSLLLNSDIVLECFTSSGNRFHSLTVF